MKTITIRDETYRALQMLKENNDSFSDVIDALIAKRISNIRQFAGGLKDSKVLDALKEETRKTRESGRARV
ncbi:MAG: antitoxin VapB family protein [Methanolinea sp.]|nr:antitoxin VapB family protein [Methanolinea sp.]